MEELTPEQALQNLDNAAAALNGTRQAHIVMQQSVAVLQSALAELAQLRNNPPALSTIVLDSAETPPA